MASLSSATMSKMRALRQSQKLGCSGAHQMEDGGWHPCSSHEEYVKAKGRLQSSGVIGTPPKRDARGSNKIKKQWENLGQRPISAIDNIQGGGLVAGAPSALIGGGVVSGGGMSAKALGWAPRDNDPDVFTDIEVARNRSRQLGCIGVSRRTSRSGKLVWMPCTNMSDYAQRTGSTALGRRHLKQNAERTITEALKKLKPKPKRERSKSLFAELHPTTYRKLLESQLLPANASPIETKGLGPRLGRGLRSAPPGMVFVDVTGAIDADKDGIVFEGKPLERPIIPKFTIPEGLARRASKLIQGTAEQNEKNRRLSGDSNAGSLSEMDMQNLLSNLGTGTSGLASRRRAGRGSEYALSRNEFTLQSGVLPPVDAGVPFPRKLVRTAKRTVRARTMPMRKVEGKYDNYSIDQLKSLVDQNVPTGPGQIRRMLEKSPYLVGSPKNVARRIENSEIDYESSRKVAELLKSEIERSPAMANFVRKYGIPVLVVTQFMPNMEYTGKFIDLDLGSTRWGSTMAGWAPLGFIALNADTFEGTPYYEFAGHKNSDIAMNTRHELAHAWETMAAKTNDKAKEHYIQQFAELFQGLDELEEQGEMTFRTTYHEAAWGTDDEHESALRISNYAETARIEWFAESIAYITDPNPSNQTRVDSLSKQNMAAVLGLDAWELESLLSSNIFAFDSDDDSSPFGMSSRRSVGETLFVPTDKEKAKEYADWLNDNPGYVDEAPIDVLMRINNGAYEENRRMGLSSRTATLQPDEQKAHDTIFGRVDEKFTGKQRPTYHHIGGVPGSGKSTLVRDGTIQVPGSSEAFHIDPDEIKTFMNGWNGGRGAQAVHPRSRHLTDMFMDEASETGGDIVVQGIGKRTEHLKMMRAAGYKTVGHFVYVPSSEADSNISQRSQNGGAVLWNGYGSQIADELRSRGTISRQITSGLYDEFFLWDNTGRKPKLAAERREDGTFVIYDQKVWNKFFGDRAPARGTLSSAEWAKGYFEALQPKRDGMSSRKSVKTNFTTVNSVNDAIESALFVPDISSRDDARIMSNLISLDNGRSVISDKRIENVDASNLYMPFPEFSNVSMENCDLTKANLTNGTFINFDSRDIDVTDGNFSRSIFFDSSISNSYLAGANFSDSEVRGILSLSGSDLRGANLSNISFNDDEMLSTIDVSGAILDGAYIGNTELIRFISDEETQWGNARIGYTNSSIPRGLRNRGIAAERRLDSLNLMNSGEIHAVFNDSLIDVNNSKNSADRKMATDNIYAIYDNLRGIDAELSSLNDSRDLIVKRLGEVKATMASLRNTENGGQSSLTPLKFIESNDPKGWAAHVNSLRNQNPKMFAQNNPQNILAAASSMYRERQILLSELSNLDADITNANQKKDLLKSVESILFADEESIIGKKPRIPKKSDRSVSREAKLATTREQVSTGKIGKNGEDVSPKVRKYINQFVDVVAGDVVGMKSTKATNDKKTADEKIADMYSKLSDAILASLDETNGDKWVRPWNLGAFMPRNAKTKKAYRGSNVFSLGITQSDSNYKHPVWGTYKMWQDLGGQVQKGERGTIIVHWSPVEKETVSRDGSVETRRFMRPRLFNVFNIDQVTGVDPEKYVLPSLSDEQRVQRMDSILEELNVDLQEMGDAFGTVLGGGLRAFYRPSTDSIHLPPFSTFNEPLGYYQTAMHELVHWTGHSQRLDRLKGAQFGNEDYAYEELVAEFGSAFLMGILGMEAEPQENHAMYIKGWKRKIKDDPDTIKNAIKDAQDAVNYILKNSPTLRNEFGLGDDGDDDSNGSLPVAEEIGDIATNAISPSSGVPGPVSPGRDMVGMRSARLSEWMDVTDAGSFGQSGIELRNTFGRADLEKLQKVLQDEQSVLSKTIDEWQKTGIWNGQTNGVALPRTLYPKSGITRNITAEESSAMGDKDALGSIFNNYLSQIEKQLTHVNSRLSDLDRFENGDDISNINSISIRDLPTFAALAKRGKQIRIGRSGKDDGSWSLTTDDPDAVWLIHTGAPVLENGVLDPSFTLPKGGDGTYTRQGMDTQRLNGITRRNIISLYEDARRDVDSFELALKKYDETGIWDGEGLANNLKLPAFQRNHKLFNNYTEGKDDDKISPEYLRENARSSISGGRDTMTRYQYGYNQAKAGKEHLSYSHISMGPSTGYVRDDFPTSKTYLVRVPKQEVIEGFPSGEFQIFETRTPVASFEFPSRFNDSVEVLDVAIALFEKAAQKHISRDKSPSGMLSRRDLVSLHGKSLEEAIDALELTDAESMNGFEELEDAINGLENLNTRKIHPALRDIADELIASISFSVSSDGIIMIHALPNPLIEKEMPVKRDWRLIEIPDGDVVDAAYKLLMENQISSQRDGEWENFYSPDGKLIARSRSTDKRVGMFGKEHDIEGRIFSETEHFDESYFTPFTTGVAIVKFKEFLTELLKKTSTGSKRNIPMGGGPWVSDYIQGLKNPQSLSFLGGIDGLHDAFGHFGIGRGFDRHGEWANALALISLVDHPDFDATPRERDEIKREWFLEYALPFLMMRETRTPDVLDQEFGGAFSNYGGNINEVIAMLDTAPRQSSGMSSRNMPITRASDLMLKEISDSEILRHKREALIRRAQNNPGVLSSSENYRMSHTAPERDSGASLSDLTENGIYPDYVYSSSGLGQFGHGLGALDKKMHKLITDLRGKPNEEITVYRAVPKNVSDDINPGDWVSPLREYADYHGQSNLEDNYKIISKKVKAGDIFTEGNSWMEWGYSPSDDSRTGMSSVMTPTRPTIPPPPGSPTRPTIPPPPGAPTGRAIQTPEATPSVRPTLSLTREAADAIEDFRNAIKVDDNDPYTLNASSFVGHLDNIFAQTFLSDLPEGHNVLIRDIPVTSRTKAIPYAVATKINGALVVKQITQETYDYLYRVRKLDKQLHHRNNFNFLEQANIKAIEYEITNIAKLSKKYKMKVPQLLLIDAANENDKFLQEQYGDPNFVSAATMSANGVMTVYNGKLPSVHTMRHEWGHDFDRVAERISEDAEGIFRLIKQWHHEKISDGVAWTNASDSDKRTSQEWKNQYLGKGWTVRFASRPFKVGTDAVTDYSQSSYDLGEYSLVEDFAESVALFLIDREMGFIGKKYTSEGGERGNVRFAALYPKRAEILTALFDQSDEWMRNPQGMSSKTKRFDDRFEKKYKQVNPDGDGDCYSAAFNLLENLTERFSKQEGTEVRMVHGIPLGTGGEAAGIRYGHAWVEVDMTPGEILRLNEKLRVAKTESEKARIEANIRQLRLMGDVTVYDYSNGGRHEIPKFLYYAMGNIDESEVRRYSLDESRKYALNNKHYGPWK